jgi:hypothetical protein
MFLRFRCTRRLKYLGGESSLLGNVRTLFDFGLESETKLTLARVKWVYNHISLLNQNPRKNGLDTEIQG